MKIKVENGNYFDCTYTLKYSGTVGFLVISARGRGAFIVSDIYSN